MEYKIATTVNKSSGIRNSHGRRIKARMTCIGQRKPAILPEYVHMLCTHQPVQQNFSVRSKSYSAVYFDSRGYFSS